LQLTPCEITLSPAQTVFLRSRIGFDSGAWAVESAGTAGSDRRFVRVSPRGRTGESYVLVVWDSSDRDWDRFCCIVNDLGSSTPFLPRILALDPAHGLILEEDLGAMTVGVWARGKSEHDMEWAYRKVIDALAQWQEIEPSACATISSRSMDLEMFLWESEYFARYCVTEYFGEERLLGGTWERLRRRIAEHAASLDTVCIHRDFQSENVLLQDDRVRFVDFQGARMGPPGYDLASLILDPYMGIDSAMHRRLLDYYRGKAPVKLSDGDYLVCALQRLMQALGAYGNLSLHKGKERFHAYIAPALARLESAAATSDYGYLAEIARACIDKLKAEP
jgi:aminoglycoside/choline kinase family phosphotransferase